MDGRRHVYFTDAGSGAVYIFTPAGVFDRALSSSGLRRYLAYGIYNVSLAVRGGGSAT